MRINNNISSLHTQGALFMNNRQVSNNLEKLSTGLRINRASDDAAGLALSEGLRTQVRGAQQAKRNALDGISALNIAEGAMNELHNIMQRKRELAIQASTNTYSETERSYMDSEFQALAEEIERIIDETNFNGIKLLTGPQSSNQEILTNRNERANALINFRNDAIELLATDIMRQLNAGGGVHSFQNSRAAQDARDSGIPGALSDAHTAWRNDIRAMATSIIDAQMGDVEQRSLLASAASNVLTIPDTTQIHRGYAAVGATFNSGFEFLGNNPNITRTTAGTLGNSDYRVNGLSIASTTALGDLSETQRNALRSAGVDVDGHDFGAGGNTTALTLTNAQLDAVRKQGRDAVAAMDMAEFNINGVSNIPHQIFDTRSRGGDSMFNGRDLWIGANDVVGVDSITVDYTAITFAKGMASIGGSTGDSAIAAIGVLDDMIEEVSRARSDIGALVNRLESTINNLTTSIVNQQAAESQIRDVDFASEASKFTTNQILVQSATSMLSQANASTQGVLALLR
ncbi:MAG: hypothetical protein FWE23_05155 [Chitinivibrionia bacterium]|nr:hypothetical protein [Chitinivibrionia bacterium]